MRKNEITKRAKVKKESDNRENWNNGMELASFTLVLCTTELAHQGTFAGVTSG